MSEQFERLISRFEEFQSRVEQENQRFTDIEQLQTDVAAIEATARSSDQSVTVTAGPGGGITDIKFTAQALHKQPDELASGVLSTLHEAVADAARQQAGVVDAHLGDNGMNTTERVLQTQAEMFGTDKEELRSRLADSRPASEDSDRYDDYTSFAEQSFIDTANTPQHEDTTTREDDEPRSAGEEFLRNLFNGEEDNR